MASTSNSPLSLRSPGLNGSIQTPNNSPHGSHVASQADEDSPSLRKRFTKSLRRKIHQNSDENRPLLSRRKSIKDIFGTVRSRKQSVQEDSKDENPQESQDATSAKHGVSVDASPSQGLQRRKSLSGMFGTISQKVTPKKGSVFRRISQSYHKDLGSAIEADDVEKNSGELATSQAVASALDNPPPLPPRPISNQANKHISFADQLADVVDDIKRSHVGTRQSSIGSDSTLFVQAPAAYPTPVVPSRLPPRYSTDENRAGTPDSYLQALIETRCPEVSVSKPAEDHREGTSDAYLLAIIQSHCAEITASPAEASSATPTSHLEPLVESQSDATISPMPTDSGRGTPDSYLQALIESESPTLLTPSLPNDHERNCPSVSPSKCQPVEPVDFIDNFFNETVVLDSSQPSQKIPQIKISLVSDNDVSDHDALPSEGEAQQKITNEKIKLVVATMTENFHAVESEHEVHYRDMMVQEFERDQNSVWDAIKIGKSILQQPEPERKLKSFPSSEDVLAALPVRKTRKDRQVRQHDHTDSDNVVPIRLKIYGSDTGIVPEVVQETTTIDEGTQYTFTETSPLGAIRVEFPSTIRQFANVRTFGSKEEAVAAILDYEHSELSNYGIYDRQNRFVHARLPEAGQPDQESMKQHGLEAFRLPSRSALPGKIEGPENMLPSVEAAMNEIWECEDPPSPSKRSEDALYRYLSLQTLSNVIIQPTMVSSELPEQQPHTSEVDSIMNDDFFFEDQSQMAASSEGIRSADQSRLSSLAGFLLNKDDISRPSTDGETLYWGNQEDNTPSTPTWADLGRAHLARSPVIPSLDQHTDASTEKHNNDAAESDIQEYNNDADHSDSSGRSSPYQKFFFDPSFLQCPESRVPEKIDWQSGGFCEGCHKKVHIGEKSSNVTSSRHFLTYEIFHPNLHAMGSAEDEHKESIIGEDIESYQGDSEILFESVPLDEVAGPSSDIFTIEELANPTSDTVNPVSEAERPMLPRISSANGREYTLSIPAAESFSWSAFLHGNIDGVLPFFGQSAESVSDDFDASDTSISSKLGDSINVSSFEDPRATLADMRPSINESLNEEHNNLENSRTPILSSNNPFRPTVSTSDSEVRKSSSMFESEFEVTDHGIHHKSDPTFALLYSDFLNHDAKMPPSSETPLVRRVNTFGEIHAEALPENNLPLEHCWNSLIDSDLIGARPDLTIIRQTYAESRRSIMGIEIEPTSTAATSRDCSYGSHGGLSLRDGFKFSEHDDLLLNAAGEAILEGQDEEEEEELRDAVLPELVFLENSADISQEPLPFIPIFQEFPVHEVFSAPSSIGTKEQRPVLRNEELLSVSTPRQATPRNEQGLQMEQDRETPTNVKNWQPHKKTPDVAVREISSSQKAVPSIVSKKPKISHLISMLEARGVGKPHGASPPAKTGISTPSGAGCRFVWDE